MQVIIDGVHYEPANKQAFHVLVSQYQHISGQKC